jgi:hypothetical protein
MGMDTGTGTGIGMGMREEGAQDTKTRYTHTNMCEHFKELGII